MSGWSERDFRVCDSSAAPADADADADADAGLLLCDENIENGSGSPPVESLSRISRSRSQSQSQAGPAVEGVMPGSAEEALMAVPNYPGVGAGHDPGFLSVSEVVNAVLEPGMTAAPSDSAAGAGAGVVGPQFSSSSSPPMELYMSDSEMTEALSEVGGVPLDPYTAGHGQMGMGNLMHQFIDETAAVGHTISTLSEESDDEDAEGLIMDYETPVERSTPLSVQDDDDNDDIDGTRGFYIDEEEDENGGDDRAQSVDPRVAEIDFDDFYRVVGADNPAQLTDVVAAPLGDHYFTDSLDPEDDLAANPHFPASVIHGTTHERNFNIDQFISQWLVHSSAAIPNFPSVRTPLPQNPISNIIFWNPPEKTVRPSRHGRSYFDIQQIPWWDALRVQRSDARALRDLWYTSYHNLEYSHQQPGAKLPQEEFGFREKAMYTRCKATIEHFQLRNLMSVPAYNTVHFAQHSRVYSWIPAYDDLSCLIDLTRPDVESGLQGPVKISTLKSAHHVTIAGGFTGEYAVRMGGGEGTGSQGYVTKDPNGITNHLDIVPSRTSRSPMGIFASNDRHLRVLDCETNTFVADHELSRAINCTSTSPDSRLRVVIGDSPDAWVIEADTGRPVHPLRGHHDFGFACAWSPDMRHIATSNQDKTLIIWDARMWRILSRIESDVAGYRSLRYSPVGGGPRTLLATEPADRIALINAQTYTSRQVHDFFGEIGGADFSPDGSAVWVANTDEHFGGFMEFERRQWGQRYGNGGGGSSRKQREREPANEWVRESELDEDERCVLSERERQMRFWWNLSDEEHEGLLLF